MSDEIEIENEEAALWLQVAREEGGGRARAYIVLGRMAFDIGKYGESLAMCETAKDILENEDASRYQIELYQVNIGISRNLEKLERIVEAAVAIGEAILWGIIIEDEEVDELLREQGRYWYAAGESERAIDCFRQAMEWSEMYLRDVTSEIDYFNLGLALHKLERYEESVDAFRKSRAISKEVDNTSLAVECEFKLAEIYVDLGDAAEIEHYGQRALDFYSLIGNVRVVWSLKLFLGISKRIFGELDMAERLFVEAKDLAISSGWQEWEFLIKVDKELAKIYMETGRESEAAEILRRAQNVEEVVS